MKVVSSIKKFIKRALNRSAVGRRVFQWMRPSQSYKSRVKAELRVFDNQAEIHQLPEIYHYWSNRYLRPQMEKFGLQDPEQFFFSYAAATLDQAPGVVRLVSVGAGNGDMEARLARRLQEAGYEGFEISCLDINRKMLKRAKAHAEKLGVSRFISTIQADFNHWNEEPQSFDIVIANQSLHHVVNLEALFQTITTSLKHDGLFLVSDMIGRNGHQRWPEVLDAMEPLWEQLPREYRYNRAIERQEDVYINQDCSNFGFEGVRAQDILPLLVERFHFELFVPFANLVTPFIDRNFGHNFDPGNEWDRQFIDRIHQIDEQAILSGRWKPTQMIAALKTKPCKTKLIHPKLNPKYCVRDPAQ